MPLTPDEHRVLASASLTLGCYASDPFLKTNPVEVKSLLRKGLIQRKQDWEFSGSDEPFYSITSAGRLELNLYGKEEKR